MVHIQIGRLVVKIVSTRRGWHVTGGGVWTTLIQFSLSCTTLGFWVTIQGKKRMVWSSCAFITTTYLKYLTKFLFLVERGEGVNLHM